MDIPRPMESIKSGSGLPDDEVVVTSTRLNSCSWTKRYARRFEEEGDVETLSAGTLSLSN